MINWGGNRTKAVNVNGLIDLAQRVSLEDRQQSAREEVANTFSGLDIASLSEQGGASAENTEQFLSTVSDVMYDVAEANVQRQWNAWENYSPFEENTGLVNISTGRSQESLEAEQRLQQQANQIVEAAENTGFSLTQGENVFNPGDVRLSNVIYGDKSNDLSNNTGFQQFRDDYDFTDFVISALPAAALSMATGGIGGALFGGASQAAPTLASLAQAGLTGAARDYDESKDEPNPQVWDGRYPEGLQDVMASIPNGGWHPSFPPPSEAGGGGQSGGGAGNDDGGEIGRTGGGTVNRLPPELGAEEDRWTWNGDVLVNQVTGEEREVPNPGRLEEGETYAGDTEPVTSNPNDLPDFVFDGLDDIADDGFSSVVQDAGGLTLGQPPDEGQMIDTGGTGTGGGTGDGSGSGDGSGDGNGSGTGSDTPISDALFGSSSQESSDLFPYTIIRPSRAANLGNMLDYVAALQARRR